MRSICIFVSLVLGAFGCRAYAGTIDTWTGATGNFGDGTQFAQTVFAYRDASQRNPYTDFYANGQFYQVCITDAEHKNTYRQLDSAGNLTRVRYPSGDEEILTYWGDGKLRSRTVWEGATVRQITYTYDEYGNLQSTNYPDGGYLLYEYDAFGRRIGVQDFRNAQDNIGGISRIAYVFDSLGRIRRVTDQDGYLVDYNYRADGQKARVEVTSPVETEGKIYSIGYQYDLAGRLTRVFEPLKEFGAQTLAALDYDENGNRSHLIYALTGAESGPLVDIEYRHDLQNRLVKMNATGGPAFVFGGTGGSGGDEAFVDGLGRLLGATETLTTAAGVPVTYTYGGDNAENWIDYNRRSELLNEQIEKNGAFLWNGYFRYLKDGNLDSRMINPPLLTDFTYDGDLMASASGGENFTLDWDLNGRLTQGVQTAVEYNWDDRLRWAQSESGWIQVKYDADGNRVRRNSSVSGNRKYILDIAGGLPVILLEIDPGLNASEPADDTVVKTYLHAGPQVLAQYDGDASAAKYFYLHDRLGSVKLVIDTAGNVKNRYVYEPFGLEIESETEENITNPFRFTGQFFDSEIHQYHLRARQYDPQLYRFITRDPVRGMYTEPMTLHQYLYCLNDPINNVDPSGELLNMLFTSKWAMKMRAKSAAAGASAMAFAQRVWVAIGYRATAISNWMDRTFASGKNQIAQIGTKLQYLFGQASPTNLHNLYRSQQMLRQLNRIGIQDTPAAREYIKELLNQALNDPSCISGISDRGYVMREILLKGPDGMVKLVTYWDGFVLKTFEVFGKGS